MAKIAEAFSSIRNGANIKQGLDDSGYPITRIETISNRTVDRNKMGYAGVTDISKYADYVLQDGDILMSHINSETHLGKVALYEKQEDETIIHGMNLLCLRPKQELLNSRFAFYYLSSEAFLRQIPRITKKSVNQASFNVAALKELSIPIPTIETQIEVVRGLDKVSKLIALRKEQLAKLDQLVKSRFIELFGGISDSKKYPYKAVKELTDVISGGTPSRDVNEYWEGGTIPWVKTTELQNNIITEIDEHITEAGLDNSSAKLVPAGTVLIAMYGQGKTRGMTGCLGVEACTNQACACILPSDSINQKFLWQFFVLSYDNLRDMAKGGNQPNLNGNIIKNYPVLYPPMELQEQFATFVEQTDKSKLVIQQSLDKLELLKKSLMQEYFG